jgi:hypothetical protein
MTITSAYCTSAKAEHYYGAHCFGATVTPTATTSSGQFTLTALSSAVGVCVGMSVSGTGIPAGSVVASIDSATQITISKAATASGTGVALSIAGDTMKISLFKASVTGTYGAATVNYTDMTGNSDETSGTGYTAGGLALTNVSPVTSGTTAYVNFSPNPSWTSASFSTDGCLIYNSSARLGGTSGTNTGGAGRAIGVFSFGGTQSVSSGTLTILMPAATVSTAVLRLS